MKKRAKKKKAEYALVIIKPDGMAKGIAGHVLNKLNETGLELIAAKITIPQQALAEEHYRHIRNAPFYQGVINYFLGKYHEYHRVFLLIYSGSQAIGRLRTITGATNPEEASLKSIRGAFGRISTKGVYENVLHVSSNSRDAKREIQLWFSPEEIGEPIFKVKQISIGRYAKKVWA